MPWPAPSVVGLGGVAGLGEKGGGSKATEWPGLFRFINFIYSFAGKSGVNFAG